MAQAGFEPSSLVSKPLGFPLHHMREIGMFMTKGWPQLLIQVENVFGLEMIRKRIGNHGSQNGTQPCPSGKRFHNSRLCPSLAALGVALLARQDGTSGVHIPVLSGWCFLSSAFGAPVFPFRTASPVGHELPSPLLSLPHPAEPEHTVLRLTIAFSPPRC